MTTGNTELLLRLDGLTKAYPGVVANSDVSFAIGAGEIHALLGENGAGKSTLVKMIYGLVKPDQGQMQLRGTPYAPKRPAEARRAAIDAKAGGLTGAREINGRGGLEPVRYDDWEVKGLASDF